MQTFKRITKNDVIYSVEPCTASLTFDYWIYCVPQYKPGDVLMLGYAGGTVAGLIRKIYGDVPITAVDIDTMEENKYDVNFVQADANEYVKTCRPFDCVIVDLFDGFNECPFIFSPEFVSNLERIANYVIINTVHRWSVAEYADHFDKVETLAVGRGGGNNIHYFKRKGLELDLFAAPRSDDHTLRI